MKLSFYSNLQHKSKIKSSEKFKSGQNILKNFSNHPKPAKSLKIYNLSSKFNINFTSAKISEKHFEYKKQLNEFCEDFEKRIKEELEILQNQYFSFNSPVKSSKDVDLINEQFKKDGIERIENTGVSLNNVLRYLSTKEQLNFGEIGACANKTAFVLDEMSVCYLLELKRTKPIEFRYYLEMIKDGEFVLYCINLSDDEKNKIIQKTSKILGFLPRDVKVIKTDCQNSEKTQLNHYPNKNEIRKVIDEYLESKCDGDIDKKTKFLKILMKYFNDTSLFLSYPKICLELRKIHEKIADEVYSKSKSLDDVYYIYPTEGKSHDLINYFYAMENNVKADKFLSLKQVQNLPCDYQNKRTFVVLDDFSLSGNSFCNGILEPFYKSLFRAKKAQALIFAPIIYTKTAKTKIENKIKTLNWEYGNFDVKFLENIKHLSIAQIENSFYAPKDFKSLTLNDANYLLQNMQGGFGGQFASIFTPYMIPDNNSDISEKLGRYFLNNY